MKRGLLGCSVAACLATAATGAIAADLPDYQAPYQPVYDWSGIYIGLHGGYLWGNTDWNTGPGFPVSISPDGFAGGGLLGYNFQVNNFVLGLEGDFTIGDIDEGPGSFGAPGLQSVNVNYAASIRGRLGYAFDSTWMLFATGGFTLAELELYDSGTVAPVRDAQTLTGWTVGGGVEAKLDNLLNVNTNGALTGRLEYLYADYGRENFTLGNNPDPADLTTHTVRAAVIWRFNGLFQ